MRHKVSLNLFDVHPYFKVSFTIYLAYIDQETGNKFNIPIVNKFTFDGNEYFKVSARGYVCIDITSRLDRGEGYNRNRFFAMDAKNLFFFTSALERLLCIFRNPEVKLYTISGDTGELLLNKELANEYAVRVRVNSGKVISMVPTIVEQDQVQYEGCCMYVNTMDNLSYLTISEMSFLISELKKISIPQMTTNAILLYHMLDKQDTKELEKKEPVNEIHEEEKQDTNVRLHIDPPHEIPDEL